MAHSKPSSKPKPEEKKDEENMSPKEKEQERCYTSPWSRSRGGGIFLVILLVVTYFIYKGVSSGSSDNQPLPGSTNETALTLPSGNQLMSLSALGIQNWKQQKFAYFWLQPGESAPVLNPEETRGCCGPYTFRVRPSEQITQRHRLPTLKWSDWYIADPSGYVATPKGKSVTIPASVCGLQWRNQTDHPIMIGIGFRR